MRAHAAQRKFQGSDFSTFYENFSWIIRAWLNPLDPILQFSYFKLKVYQPGGHLKINFRLKSEKLV